MTPESVLLHALLGFALLTAVATALARTIVATLVAFGAYSLGLAMVWVVFRAPDVALTEAAVGAGVTTALFVLVAARAARPAEARRDGADRRDAPVRPPGSTAEASPPRRARRGSLAVAAAVTVGLLLTVPSLPPVGAADAPGFGPVTKFYLEDAAARGIDNVVTAVLVVYRGFDTFGEIAVVFAAAVAVLAVFGREVVA